MDFNYRTYATGTLQGYVRYQQSVYLEDLYSLTHPTINFWCDTCASGVGANGRSPLLLDFPYHSIQ